MRGLKLLFREWRSFPIALHIFCGLCVVGLTLIPFFMHEPLGSEDYIICKMFLFGMPFFMATLGSICTSFRLLCGNKLIRSVPISKQLYTRSVPAFILILTVGLSCVMLAAYFIFLKSIGAETTQYADALICGAIINLPPLIIMPLVADVPNGGAMLIWLCYLPIVGILKFFGQKISENGFGLSLPVSIAVFLVTAIFGAVWGFGISDVKFKNANVKLVQNNLLQK